MCCAMCVVSPRKPLLSVYVCVCLCAHSRWAGSAFEDKEMRVYVRMQAWVCMEVLVNVCAHACMTKQGSRGG